MSVVSSSVKNIGRPMTNFTSNMNFKPKIGAENILEIDKIELG